MKNTALPNVTLPFSRKYILLSTFELEMTAGTKARCKLQKDYIRIAALHAE